MVKNNFLNISNTDVSIKKSFEDLNFGIGHLKRKICVLSIYVEAVENRYTNKIPSKYRQNTECNNVLLNTTRITNCTISTTAKVRLLGSSY